MTNIYPSYREGESHSVPHDSYRQQILSARTVLVQNITLGADARQEITIPKGTYEVEVKAASAVTFYESAATYTKRNTKQDGSIVDVTYGSGYVGTLMSFPVYNKTSFWLNGSGIAVTLMFYSLLED